ncbi:aldehyde dehydrogenase family protein [Rhodococcus hoagii]|nr:aldehyde dehydrogenase family protein [Prescottella equi]
MLARLLPEYLDADAIAVVEGDGRTTRPCSHRVPIMRSSPAAPRSGRKILAGAAPHLTPVTLELGGKDPVIVMEDADLAVAARRIAWTKVFASGQACLEATTSWRRVPSGNELVRQLVHSLEEFRAEGCPRGLRIVNERQFDRLAGYLAGTGARVVYGGGSDRASLTVEPTILVGPEPRGTIMREEIFGPSLQVLAVDSLDEAIDFVTARPKPLAATSSRSRRGHVAGFFSEISAGAAVVNHLAVHVVAPQLQLGGVGSSGMGRYHGRWGFETLSHRKAVLVKRSALTPLRLSAYGNPGAQN